MQKITRTFFILVSCLLFSVGSSASAQSAQPVSVDPDTLQAERAAAIEDAMIRAFESDWVGMEAGVAVEIQGDVYATDDAGYAWLSR